MKEKCTQVGSNPADLNEPGGEDKYTVCGGMTSGDLESWGEDDEYSKLAASFQEGKETPP